jgi:hypothetical protein
MPEDSPWLVDSERSANCLDLYHKRDKTAHRKLTDILMIKIQTSPRKLTVYYLGAALVERRSGVKPAAPPSSGD